VREAFANQVEWAPEVRGERVFKILERGMLERADGNRPGIVDQDIDAMASVENLRDDPADLARQSYIRGDELDAAATGTEVDGGLGQRIARPTTTRR
jgi:hypothetical protein